VLDQGYWPDGLLTPPSDEAMVHDISTMKRLGFTMLRKHIKVEPLRWYHHCDRLGVLVWQDMVNGGGRYRTAAVTWPGRLPGGGRRLRDDRYAVFGRTDAHGREEFRREARATVALLRNAPSVVCWVPFNEGWGQFDASAVAAEVAALDPTRVVDHASGWHDQGAGDVWSLHVYRRRFRAPRRAPEERRVLALTEYGGYDLTVPDHTWGPEHTGYKHFDAADSLTEAFRRLHDDELVPAIGAGLSATVYTQLSDVEDEVNGLLTYDREVLKVPEDVVQAALGRMRAAFTASTSAGTGRP
jgi:beta-galactosidase/beta-glucuronidase